MKNVRLSRSEVAKFLKGPEVEAMLNQVGKKVADNANSAAPVGATGALSNSHYHEVEDSTDRKAARVKSDLDYAAAVASRTGYLTRALDGTEV